ncbi:MAG: hypothetical protein IJA61_01825 [Clostridia bacterium]|nr:hypothetical protein [Clostridia bacterium]
MKKDVINVFLERRKRKVKELGNYKKIHFDNYFIPENQRPQFDKGTTPLLKLREQLPNFEFGYSSFEEASEENMQMRLNNIVSLAKSFGNALSRMDEYFTKNHYYDEVDYNQIINSILDGSQSFNIIIDETDTSYAGQITRDAKDYCYLEMNPQYVQPGIDSESTICHEFIHFLVFGISELSYIENSTPKKLKIIDYLQEDYDNNLYTLVLDCSSNIISKPTLGNILVNDNHQFIKEGFTEYLTNLIYPDSYNAYLPQVKMIKFLNKITGGNINFRNFLKSNLDNYAAVFGEDNFRLINDYCNEFHTKWQLSNATLDYKTDPDYNRAQDIVCTTILNNIKQNPNNYSTEKIVDIISAIKAKAPIIDEDIRDGDKYDLEIKATIQSVAASKTTNVEDRRIFYTLLRDVIADNADNTNKLFYLPDSDFILQACNKEEFFVSYKGNSKHLLAKNTQQGIELCTSDFSREKEREIYVEINPSTNSYTLHAINHESREIDRVIITPQGKGSDKFLVQNENNSFIIDFTIEQSKRQSKINHDLDILKNMETITQPDLTTEESTQNSIKTVDYIIDKLKKALCYSVTDYKNALIYRNAINTAKKDKNFIDYQYNFYENEFIDNKNKCEYVI